LKSTGIKYESKETLQTVAPQPLTEVFKNREAAGGREALAMTQGLQSKLNNWQSGLMALHEEKTVVQAKMDALKGKRKEGSFKGADTTYSKAYDTAASSIYTKQAKYDIEKSINELYATAKDPDDFFKKAKVLHKQELDQSPDDAIRTVLDLHGKNKIDNMYSTLARNEYINQQKAQEISHKTEIGTLEDDYILAVGSGKDGLEQLGGIKAIFTKMLEAQTITPEEVAEKTRNIFLKGKREVILNEFRALDTKAAVTKFNKYKVDGDFTSDEKLEIRNKIKSELNAREIDTGKAKKVRKAVNNSLFKDAITILESGHLPDNFDAVNMIVEDFDPEHARNFRIAHRNYQVGLEFGKKSHIEQQKIINEKKTKATTIAKKEEVEYLEKQYKLNTSNSVDRNEATGVAERYFLSVGSPEFDDNLSIRLEDTLETETKTRTHADFLSVSEKADFVKSLAGMDLPQKIEVIGMVNSKLGDEAYRFYDEVGKESKGFAFAGDLSISNPTASGLVLLGQALDINLPKHITDGVQSKLSGVYGLADPQEFNKVVSGLKNYVKGLIHVGGEVEKDGLLTWSGQDTDDILTATIGGVIQLNDVNVLMPYKMTEDKFEEKLDKFVVQGDEGLTEIINDLPDSWGGNDYQLKMIDRGKYLIFDPATNMPITKIGETKPYILDIN